MRCMYPTRLARWTYPLAAFAAARTDQFDLTSFKGDASVDVYRTSAQDNFSRVTSFDVPEPAQFSFTLPSSSITTLVVRVASVSDLAIPRI